MGNRLLTATVDSDDLAATRSRWQSATRSAALIVLAVTVLLFTGRWSTGETEPARCGPT